MQINNDKKLAYKLITTKNNYKKCYLIYSIKNIIN